MRSLAARFRDVPVLVCGKGDSLGVAQSYGFSKAVTSRQLVEARPSAAPFSPKTSSHSNPCPIRDLGYGSVSDPFRSAMVFTDPDDWAQDLQILTDVVTSNGVPGRHPAGQLS